MYPSVPTWVNYKKKNTGGGASFYEQVIQSSDITDTYRQQPFPNNG